MLDRPRSALTRRAWVLHDHNRP